MPSVTMWDFSWLLRRDHDEAEYAEVARVLAELADRGYDVVRIDAFPHWVASDRNGGHSETITSIPQPELCMWGNHRPVDVRPRAALLEFLAGLRERGIRAGLSTWFTADASGRSDELETPGDLARVWLETLAVVDEAGLLDTVAYVDLCNEWPRFAPGVMRAVSRDDGWPDRPFTEPQVRSLSAYRSSLDAVKRRYPGLPVTFSYTLDGARPPLTTNMMRLDTSSFDLADVHFWVAGNTPRCTEETEWTTSCMGERDALARHQRRVREHYPRDRAAYLRELAALMDLWAGWAAERQLPLWTTEGWASIFWEPDLSESWTGWEYIEDVGEQAVGLALERGWQGICTSNFSQPHHRELWGDVGWHRRLTDRIRSNDPTSCLRH
ncbi:MAG TPA: cellulase-like family protein [Gaiellaceae bacterium]|nr:cellulase-like family protein [Gaiellaceae bacterium]